MDRFLIFDESGNLGSNGRYFVVSCIDTCNAKEIQNLMKRKIGLARTQFPALATLHTHEVKAKDAYPCIKYHIAECLAKKDLTISYIVADLQQTPANLLIEKNMYYNFLIKKLIEEIVTPADAGNNISIIYDNHSTRTGSVNSLDEYLTLSLIYERRLNISLKFARLDSNDKNAYHVQAADYVANALYTHYEFNNDLYYDILRPKINCKILYPLGKFGL